MTDKKEGIFAIIAAFFVLFSAMLNPLVSAIIAVVMLTLFAIFKFFRN